MRTTFMQLEKPTTTVTDLFLKNIWSHNKRNYSIRNNEIVINHLYSNKDLPFLVNIVCKYIFLKSFFKIYFRKNGFIYSAYKRIIPHLLMPLIFKTY